MRASDFVKTLSDDNLHEILENFAKFEDQCFLGDSYLWEATEELMRLLEVRDVDGIQRTFWARVLHTEVCKNLAWQWNLAWRWINERSGEQ